MIKIFSLSASLLLTFIVAFPQYMGPHAVKITKGQMPNMTVDKNNIVHIVYGRGDSIMYISSKNGVTFNSPSLVAVLPKLMSSAMRGPQIASAENGLVVTECTNQGNIYCYKEGLPGKWTKIKRINDVNESAKEALMALSADGLRVYTIWLGIRGAKGQNVYGSESVNGGKTWTKNILVYASPDGSVCECCKPSVVVKAENVFVMFRNLVSGNRDLYLIKSTNGGQTFGEAIKLGNGSWKLDGCPMDGGGLVINKNGNPETVWRREGRIFAASPGTREKEIGEGKGCSIETLNNKVFYAWSEGENIIVKKPDGTKMNPGKGSLPLLKALNASQVICVWENEREIHGSVIDL